MKHLNNSEKSGFTILELALSMLFISFLLLAIGFVSVQLAVVYENGITIKVVNNNGRELIDEFSRTILLSHYNRTLDFVPNTYTEKRGTVRVKGEEYKDVQLHGAFCTGAYSYIWNTGYVLNRDDVPENNGIEPAELTFGDDDEKKDGFRLARVNDTDRAICKSVSGGNSYSGAKASNYVEFLSPSENDLVFYEFVVFPPAVHEATGHALFSGTFLLGTMSGNIDITTTGNFCEVSRPDSFASDFPYCAINKFNFAARATGGLTL